MKYTKDGSIEELRIIYQNASALSIANQIINVQDEEGKSALFWSIRNYNIATAKYIIEIGADVNAATNYLNVGSEGNSWYSMLTTDAHALSTSDNEILDMMIYPNPVDGNYVTIVTPVQGSKEIQVFTVTGRKVMDTVINGNTLDVSSFNSGFYILKVTVDGQSKVSKLVVR